MIAVVAGLNQTAVTRLKFTWQDVNQELKKKIMQYQELFNPSASYRVYREQRLRATSKGLPVIPYMYFLFFSFFKFNDLMN